MHSPQGLPFIWGRMTVDGSLDFVQTVETAGRTYPLASGSWAGIVVNVALMAKGGETVYVARDLDPDSAREVAIRLTSALQAIREERRQPQRNAGGRRSTEEDDLVN